MQHSVNSVADHVLEIIPMVMRTIRKEFRSQRGPNFSIPEFRSLGFINRTSGCSLTEVADHLGLEAPTASKLVDLLVQRGLVTREEDPQDRRRVRLNISAKGKKKIDTAYDHTREFLVERLLHLNEDEREQLIQATEILRDAFMGEPIIHGKESNNV